MKVTVESAISRERVDLDVDFRPIPVLATGTIRTESREWSSIGSGGPKTHTAETRKIEWIPNEAVAAVLRGAKKPVPAVLLDGVPQQDQKVGPCVVFESVKLRVRISDKPDLAELWQWMWDARRAQDEARTAYWTAERQSAIDAFLAAIPAGSVAVRQIGSAPDPMEAGMSVGVWQSEDGRTFAGYPANRCERVGYVEDTKLTDWAAQYEAHEAERRRRVTEKLEREQAYRAELLATVVPADALATYRKYRGDDERAWEQGDEGAWADIRHYRDAIEAQKLASPSAAVIRRESAPEDLAAGAEE